MKDWLRTFLKLQDVHHITPTNELVSGANVSAVLCQFATRTTVETALSATFDVQFGMIFAGKQSAHGKIFAL